MSVVQGNDANQGRLLGFAMGLAGITAAEAQVGQAVIQPCPALHLVFHPIRLQLLPFREHPLAAATLVFHHWLENVLGGDQLIGGHDPFLRQMNGI